MGTFTSPIGVLGFGTMGAGIVQVAASAGHEVLVLDVAVEALDQGKARLAAFLDVGVARGKLTSEDAAALAARVTPTTDAGDLAACELVIESVTERLDVKATILARVSSCVAADAVIATNTSSLSVTALSAHVTYPQRFAGLHFFNPAPVMRLVEVIPGVDTSPETVERLRAWAQEIGKEAVVAKDQPGFLVNAVLMPYLNQAVQELDDGLASDEDIDTAVKLGLGYPKGPLELLDLIGLDTHLHATTAAYESSADQRFAPPPLLQRLVAAGRLGAKTGRGLRVGGVGS